MPGGGVCGWPVCLCGWGACMVGGACVAGGIHGHGGGGACVAGEMATAAGSTHPSGMHSC